MVGTVLRGLPRKSIAALVLAALVAVAAGVAIALSTLLRGREQPALPFDSTLLSDGPHSVSAAIDLTSGATEVVTSTFTISSGGP